MAYDYFLASFDMCRVPKQKAQCLCLTGPRLMPVRPKASAAMLAVWLDQHPRPQQAVSGSLAATRSIRGPQVPRTGPRPMIP
jgi:hypothetical protein